MEREMLGWGKKEKCQMHWIILPWHTTTLLFPFSIVDSDPPLPLSWQQVHWNFALRQALAPFSSAADAASNADIYTYVWCLTARGGGGGGEGGMVTHVWDRRQVEKCVFHVNSINIP